MNYSNEPMPAVNAKPTFLSDLNGRLQEVIDRQGKLIYQISDKLHSIINKRAPEPRSDMEQSPKDLSDAASKFMNQVQSLNQNNDRLAEIIAHLSDII